VADVLIVSGLACDYAAQANNGIQRLVPQKQLCPIGKFERARDVEDVQVLRFCAMLKEGFPAPIQQGMGDFSVPIGNYDTEPHPVCRGQSLGIVFGKVFMRT
jgi:hypothetical protein